MAMEYRARDGTPAATRNGTRRGRLLTKVDASAPWERWVRIVERLLQHKTRGRPRTPTETMLRMLVAQRCMSYSDRECEDECRENASVQAFLGTTVVPDHTTPCKFRNLLASLGAMRAIFEDLARLLDARGAIRERGTLVDSTIIEAPSSTKNRARARDACAHGARKGNAWYFGHEAHVGADADSGLARSVATTAANVSDISMGKDCVRPCDAEVYLDAGYVGIDKREEAAEGGELDGKKLFVAAKRSTARTEEQRFREHAVSSVRSPVEHPFHYLKDIIRPGKTRYKGRPKNDEMLCLAFAIVDLLMLTRCRVTYC